jgi:hypothetical protein
MKRLPLLLACVLVLSACSMFKRQKAPAPQPVAVRSTPVYAEPKVVDASGVAIETVRFRPGVSSVTVERMAKAEGCTGGVGAGLVTPAGPVEVYKMQCENGKVYTARCDLRQCKAM